MPPDPGPLPDAALDHLDALYGFALRLTASEAEARDLVQETFTRALGARGQFIQGTNLRAWLFRILRNIHIDGRRRERRSPIAADVEVDVENAREPVPSGREPLRGDLELDRLRSIVAKDLEAALAALSVDARTLVLLDFEGLSEAELATVLGCPAGTIKSRLARARAALRNLLQDYAK